MGEVSPFGAYLGAQGAQYSAGLQPALDFT